MTVHRRHRQHRRHGVGAVAREGQVVLLAAGRVGVTLDEDLRVLVLVEDHRQVLQVGAGLRLHRRLVDVEEQDRAAGVHLPRRPEARRQQGERATDQTTFSAAAPPGLSLQHRRHVARGRVEIDDQGPDLGPQEMVGTGGAERRQRRSGVLRVDDVTELTTEDAVMLVLTLVGEADLAALA